MNEQESKSKTSDKELAVVEPQAALFTAVRSYLSCLNEGFKLPTRHILSMLRFMYPSMALCAVVVAVTGACFPWLLQELFGLAGSGVQVSNPQAVLMWSAILFILLAVAECFYHGQMAYLFSRLGGAGEWLNLSPFKSMRGILKYAGAVFVYALVALLFAAVVLCPMAYFLGITSIWTWGVMIVFCLAFGVPYAYVGAHYFLSRPLHYIKALRQMKHGYQYWGGVLVVLMCGALVVGFMTALGCMPTWVLMQASVEGYISQLQGDVVNMPSCMWLLLAISAALSSLVFHTFVGLLYFPMAYLWGSCTAREAKKEELRSENAGGV